MLTCPGRGAVTERRTVGVDLDAETVTVFDGEDPIPPDFTLDATEFEVFDITAPTTDCLCSWHLEVDVTRAVETETFVVDDDGEPFLTSSSTNARWYQFFDGQWVDVSGGGPGVSIPVIDAPDDAGGTCRHLPPELVEATVGSGWVQAEGTGNAVTPPLGAGDQPMLFESCQYLPPTDGVGTRIDLLRFADEATATADAGTVAAQMRAGSEPAVLETELDAETINHDGLVLVRCGPIVVIVQAPATADLVTLVEAAVRSVNPDC